MDSYTDRIKQFKDEIEADENGVMNQSKSTVDFDDKDTSNKQYMELDLELEKLKRRLTKRLKKSLATN